MTQFSTEVSVNTRGKGLYDFTSQVEQWLSGQSGREGLLTLFIRHTTASLTMQENADPDVIYDLNEFFGRIAPEDNRLYRHTIEGPDDMPAHIRAALTTTQLSIPVHDARMVLGTWQGVFLAEHRAHPHTRKIVAHLIGE